MQPIETATISEQLPGIGQPPEDGFAAILELTADERKELLAMWREYKSGKAC